MAPERANEMARTFGIGPSDDDELGAIDAKANLSRVNAVSADFRLSDLRGAILSQSSFVNANFQKANLSGAVLVETNLEGASLRECMVYGCAAWHVRLTGADQRDLLIWRGDFEDVSNAYSIASPDDLYKLKDEFPYHFILELDEPVTNS